ncbi:GNAT family N-acetyltransferase [Halobacterium salinarum]|uniref:GNAT family N-acetyltransferase n=1 Tax=Halobacterium salinarum TaxID=2242 RepID=UPI0039047A72
MEYQLRLATREDAPAIRSIYVPFVESTPISFEVDPPTTTEMAERIETTLRKYPWFVCETDEGDILGYATASSLRSTPPYAWTAELTVYVAEDAHQSGIGTALYTSLLETLKEQEYYNAYAVVTLPNPASVKLHKRMGFEPIGTFPAVGYKQGKWHDVQWWYRQLADHLSDPEPPQPLTAIRESPELEHILKRAETYFDI